MRLVLTVLFCTLILCAFRPVFGTDYKFSAVVTDVDTPLSFDFPVGTIIRGQLSLATSVIPPRGPNYGRFSVTNFYAKIGNHYVITGSTSGYMEIGINEYQDFDSLYLGIATTGDVTYGRVPANGNFNLTYRGDALTSTSLIPQFIASPPQNDRSGFHFILVNNPNIGAADVDFDLTDFSIVPEPSTLALAALALALVGLIALGRRKRA